MAMLSVAEALELILTQVSPGPKVRVALSEAVGLVLAEDVVAQGDSPPFDKSLMDGYAVRASDLATGRAEFRVIEEVLAGQVGQRVVGAGEATRIMTGAPIPAGADAVVQVEHTQLCPGATERVRIETGPTAIGRNILPRGSSVRERQRVLAAGRMLRAQEVGALAELGRDVVAVSRRPRVAVLATGDELVAIHETPGPGQIRNSNEMMLVAQMRQMGVEAIPLGIARDQREDLRTKIATGLEADLLLLSGGVSAGKVDLVPSVLAELGVREVFHKVQIKPGQPLWFGVSPRGGTSAEDRPCYVFGLPGNPVSSMVCCELFAKTALRRLRGEPEPRPQPVWARLGRAHQQSGARPTYHPACLEYQHEGPVVTPVPWVGSADLCATVAANAMVLFPAGDRRFEAGSVVEVFAW